MTEPETVDTTAHPPALHQFKPGDKITYKDIGGSYIVVAVTPGRTLYVRPERETYILIKDARYFELVKTPDVQPATGRRAAFDAACWLEDPLP